MEDGVIDWGVTNPVWHRTFVFWPRRVGGKWVWWDYAWRRRKGNGWRYIREIMATTPVLDKPVWFFTSTAFWFKGQAQIIPGSVFTNWFFVSDPDPEGMRRAYFPSDVVMWDYQDEKFEHGTE